MQSIPPISARDARSGICLSVHVFPANTSWCHTHHPSTCACPLHLPRGAVGQDARCVAAGIVQSNSPVRCDYAGSAASGHMDHSIAYPLVPWFLLSTTLLRVCLSIVSCSLNSNKICPQRSMSGDPSKSHEHEYEDLSNPPPLAFRVAELLPGIDDEPLSCLLHAADLSIPPDFEGLSYAWGDPTATHTIICEGKAKMVTRNLHGALRHLRHQNQSRMLFADALW